ncbi:MAG: class I SAM-dependent methyltransferase [Actinomycetota bacterium]
MAVTSAERKEGDDDMLQEQKVTPAQAYEDYFGPAIFEPLTQVLLKYAPPQPGERVLDLACGTGIVARHVAPLVGGGSQMVGLDINPGMIEVAQAQPVPEGASIEWRQGDAVTLDLPDGAFDVVLCQQGLQFFPDRPASAGHMRRVLADGGRIVLAVWQGLERHPLYEALADAEVPHLGDLGVAVSREEAIAPFSLGDADDLRTLLTDAGLRNIEIAARSIEARFATPDRFVERMEFAYAAVVPAFAENPETFTAYLEKIGNETKPIVERYRMGDQMVVPMHTHIVVAHA